MSNAGSLTDTAQALGGKEVDTLTSSVAAQTVLSTLGLADGDSTDGAHRTASSGGGGHSSGYELPTYVGSAAGTVITGQDGFYIPVPDSQDGMVYTYEGNALGLPQNPTGEDQFAGVTGGDPGLPVPFARAQRDMSYGDGTGDWTAAFDIAATYLGELPSAQNIGSLSTQVFPEQATFIALARWTDEATAENWNADYVWFDADGTQLPAEEVPNPGFQNLLTEHWYRWSTTFNLDTNAILEVAITDLTTNITVTQAIADRYLFGGAGGAPTPTGFRYFGGSLTAAGNTLAFDNLSINVALPCEPECPEGSECIEGACCGDGVVEGNEECDPGGCGTCPWDLGPPGPNGNVGAEDLAFLLGNWGPITPETSPEVVCLDIGPPGPNGQIGPEDLAVVLGNWGPCPPPLGGGGDAECKAADCLENCQCIGRGACCTEDPAFCDAHENVTADECADAGGIYAGDDTTCEDCPDPVCFEAEGSCFLNHGDPGCCNAECCGVVCNFDPVCCESWDDICVGEAEKFCDPPSCGDGCCEGDEDCCNCELDCGPCECGDGTCNAPCEDFDNCPQDCDPVPECTIFTSQAEFEAFNAGEGKIFKGVEDFEETPADTPIAGMPDPLCGGVPNPPFANGLDQLNLCVQSNFEHNPGTPNPRGANAVVFVPLGAGFGESSDLVLANYFADSFDLIFGDPVPPDQQDNHTAVGFDVVSIFTGGTAEIRVFDKNNVEIISTTSPVDTAGSNFWGVWCTGTIGRINIWDTASGPGAGAEGGDNIQMWVTEECGEPEFCGNGLCCGSAGEDCNTCPEDCGACPCGDGKCAGNEDCESCEADCGPCPVCGNMIVEPPEECDPPGPAGCPGGEVCLGDCTCGDICGDGLCGPGENGCNCSNDCGECTCTEFNNQAEFEAFNANEGKFFKGVEDFEETPPGAGIIGFDDPLCGGIPNGPFPNGIDQLNLCTQSNSLGGAPSVPSPTGGNAQVFVEFNSGFPNASDVVLANYFADSQDLMFGDPVPPDQQDNHTGVGFDTVTLQGGPIVEIRVYDKNNEEVLSTTSPVNTEGTNFWGVWCSNTIGRINIFDPAGGAEGGDNIRMWKDSP